MTTTDAPAFHRIPLGERPRLRQIGLNVHGERRVERYVMDGLWSLHVYRWHGSLTLRGRRHPVRPGSISVEPPDTPLTWRYDDERCPHYYAHFALSPSAAKLRIPVIQPLGNAFPGVCDEMERLIALHPRNPLRAEVRLWDLLLWLTEDQAAKSEAQPVQSTQSLPFAVQTAVAIIDNELGSGLAVSALARRIGISHNQLTRLFVRSLGQGVAAYMRGRRLDRARQLLERSSLPVSAIAAEVGMPNLQQFNKFVRRGTGLAPSALRGRR